MVLAASTGAGDARQVEPPEAAKRLVSANSCKPDRIDKQIRQNQSIS
jgi:hypothetical protein